MQIKMPVIKKEEVIIEMDQIKAFRILCQTLDMDWMFDEDNKYYVYEDENEERSVWSYNLDGTGNVYDDRGDLFLLLCALSEYIVPNSELRNPIIVKGKEC